MFGQPSVEVRAEQAYVGIATSITMEGFDVVDVLVAEVAGWLERKGVAPTGPSFTRLLVIDMMALLDIEVGTLVGSVVAGDDRVIAGSVPGGTYVTLSYTAEDQDGHIRANEELQAWAAGQGLKWHNDRSSGTEVWGGRFEFHPGGEPKDGPQVTEIAYLVEDE